MSDIPISSRINRQICLMFNQEEYIGNIYDSKWFRKTVDENIRLYPELFPCEIHDGYLMKDISLSKKMSIPIRRIEIGGINYTIRPSFVMPYMTGMTDEVEKALFYRKFSVPFWALAYGFGRDAMYWFRMEQSLGRYSLVGTTIRNPADLPENLDADEKHSWLLGQKVYAATTVGNGCILGAAVVKEAGEESLKEAYGVFKKEVKYLHPKYAPKTVGTDGWAATKKAWNFHFCSTFIICCFLHVFIKIRDRAKKKYKEIYQEAASKLWDCYKANNKTTFVQRVRRLAEWAVKKGVPDVILKPIEKLRKNIHEYSAFYDFEGSHRTSNMLDRLMQGMDRHLFSTRYFHGTLTSANYSIRAWALIHNFAPFNPMTIKMNDGYKSPAERLNRFSYHDNWLHNLLISASMGGFRRAPHNPL